MSRRPALPISLYVRDRPCVVVGNATETGRRAKSLAACGASVIRVSWSDYAASACADAFAVFVQYDTADKALATRAEAVAADARRAGALLYVSDRPELSDLAMPSVAQRGPIRIAIATDGLAPALAGRLRRDLQAILDNAGTNLDLLLGAIAKLRARGPREAIRDRLKALAARAALRGELDVDCRDLES